MKRVSVGGVVGLRSVCDGWMVGKPGGGLDGWEEAEYAHSFVKLPIPCRSIPASILLELASARSTQSCILQGSPSPASPKEDADAKNSSFLKFSGHEEARPTPPKLNNPHDSLEPYLAIKCTPEDHEMAHLALAYPRPIPGPAVEQSPPDSFEDSKASFPSKSPSPLRRSAEHLKFPIIVVSSNKLKEKATGSPGKASSVSLAESESDSRASPKSTRSRDQAPDAKPASPLLDRLLASKSPQIEAVIYCTLNRWGAEFVDPENLLLKVHDFDTLWAYATKVSAKKSPTSEMNARVKSLRRWFEGIPRSGERNNSFFLTPRTGVEKKLKAMVEKMNNIYLQRLAESG
eukprot:TRINITY_DN3682_c2_g1_i1.p1 TRINITY_DN3682_c2_g1~~TRINITY_DN3682_c2_g1_i1.p1  ORF type:complete len:346 (-),score=40.16 TRINITY_DN3682_c2_g1_i1:67-1104(-)